MRTLTFVEALREALREEMLRDEQVYVIGEDIATYHGGGPFRVMKGFLQEFGEERVIETPISEDAIVGSSIGAALRGMKPIVEIMHSEFLVACYQQLVYEAPRMRFVTDGKATVPLVVRVPFGTAGSVSRNQAENPEAWFIHVPGLKVVMPSTPYDAKGLLKAAIRDDNPVLFFEHKRLYKETGEVPEEEYVLPLGRADVKREGRDVTIIATAWMVHQALAAARALSEMGIDAEVIDPRTLLPLDKQTILQSVRKTGRAVIVHEAAKTGGVGAEIGAMIAEEAFEHLVAPVIRVAAPDLPVIFPPSEGDIISAVKGIA